MSLHNTEYHNFCEEKRNFTKVVDEFLKSSETFQRIFGYIELCNKNLDVLQKSIASTNSYYNNCTFNKVCFNKSSLLNSNYECELKFTTPQGKVDWTSFGIDTLIIILADAGLIED